MLAQDSQVFQRKKDNFRSLKELIGKLHSLPENIYFSPTQLQNLRVNVSPLNLDADKATVNGEPQFFQPMSVARYRKLPRREYQNPGFRGDDFGLSNARELRISLSNYMRAELPENVQTEELSRLLSFSKWQGGYYQQRDHRLGGNEYGFHPEEKHDWRFDECYDTVSEQYPHLISYTMIGLRPDADTESQLTRAEVIMIADIILKRMPTVTLALHETYPVLMISCFSRKLRFIQGHFDGKLHLQCSKFLDFSRFNQETFDLFVRWAMSEPVGDTKTPTKPVPRKESAVAHSSKSDVHPQRTVRAH